MMHDEEASLYSSKLNENLKSKSKRKAPLQIEPPKPMMKFNITAGLAQVKKDSVNFEKSSDFNEQIEDNSLG